jgi:DNA-binding XRE family transcriptional regulator
MPTTENYRHLHDRVTARPGADDRLAALREETLGEIGLFELRKALDLSQTDVAKGLSISQAAVSQLERSKDLRLSTLRRYLARLGAHLELVAVFDEDGEERSVPFTVGDG